MAKQESDISQRCRMAASRFGGRIFRNSRGLFLTLDGSRKTRAGLEASGASDLIGWKTVTITPELVGTQLAVFLAAEVKVPGKKASPDQEKFISIVRAAGGIAGVVTSEDDLRKLMGE